MARLASHALREQISKLEEQAALAERLETAEQALSQTQAEVTAAQQALAALRASVRAEEATLKQKQQAVADAQTILKELHAELGAKKRESLTFDRIAEQQTRDDRAQLVALVPTEPAMTAEEAANA